MTKPIFNKQVLAALEVSRQLAESGTPGADPVSSAREYLGKLAILAETPQRVFSVEDSHIDGPAGRIPIRIYRPSGENGLPVTLYFHGGWFFAGGLDTHDRPMRALANAARCVIVAVDYRLAPEHPFPAAVEDAFNALRWLIEQAQDLRIDAGRIALAGDSAGGALAAVTARKAHESNIPIRFQALIYPVTDSSLSTDSWREFAGGPVVTLELAKQAWDMYVPDPAKRQEPDAAPLLAGNLANLPRALVIVGEFDPLRDEGLAYAEKLRAAGVAVTKHLYPGMPHGFFQMGAFLDAGRQAISEVAAALNQALHA